MDPIIWIAGKYLSLSCCHCFYITIQVNSSCAVNYARGIGSPCVAMDLVSHPTIIIKTKRLRDRWKIVTRLLVYDIAFHCWFDFSLLSCFCRKATVYSAFSSMHHSFYVPCPFIRVLSDWFLASVDATML